MEGGGEMNNGALGFAACDLTLMMLQIGEQFTYTKRIRSGFDDAGRPIYEEGPNENGTGMFIPLSDEQLKFDMAGSYTLQDKALLTPSTLTLGLHIMRSNGYEYKIDSEMNEIESFTNGLHAYVATRVGDPSE